MKKHLILAAVLATSSAQAGDIAFTGLGHVFSLPVCSILPGAECSSYLFAEGAVERYCAERPTGPIRVVGHSMGTGGATTFVKGLAACGLKVDAVVLFDPMVHPFGMPAGTRVLSLYSASSAGHAEGHADAALVGGDHFSITMREDLRERARAFLFATPKKITKGAR